MTLNIPCQNASKCFKQNNINVLKWHAQSPDLNPVEICGNTSSGSSMNMRSLLLVCMSFGTMCRVEWEKIPKEACRDLIESMPRRVGPVMKAKGGQTKY